MAHQAMSAFRQTDPSTALVCEQILAVPTLSVPGQDPCEAGAYTVVVRIENPTACTPLPLEVGRLIDRKFSDL